MKRASVFSNPIFRYILIGIFIGCLFPILGMLMSVWSAHLPLTLSTFIETQSHQSLLWIIDTAPLILGVTFSLIGRRENRLVQAKVRLELAVDERTSELRQANQELQKDIDERKRIESLISQGKKEWESTFDAISDMIFLTDDQDKIVRCNRSAADNLRKSYTELIGQPLAALLFPDRSIPGDVKLSGKDIEFSCFSGHYDVSIYSILADSPSPRTLYILHNITVRRQAEIEMLRQKQYFEALVVNNPAAIVVLDVDGKIQACNPAFEKLYGYTSEEVLEKQIDALITTREMVEEAERYTQQARVESVQGTGVRRRKDGSLVDVELLAVPVKVGNEKIGTLAIYHDITELLRARREAETANQAKSEFLANMSHEIRTPMNGVMGMIELTLDTAVNDEQRDYLQVALQSAETLLTLLNDILDYSKIEAKKLDFETIDFNLRTTVEDVAFSLAPRAQSKGLEMACLIHPDLQSGLRGDPARLRQILINLIGNAIKFTHQGEIVIRAEPTLEEKDHAMIRFSVQDTGIGIPKERQEAIFERFTQADGSTTRRYGGTGLGLTICKQLVSAMGGEIGVESNPGVGSTFWFTIQFEKQAHPRLAKTQPLRIESVNIRGLHILAVDDNSTNRLVLTRMVEGLNCRIDTASSGAKGLELLRNAYQKGDPYQIVLLDMQMPGMDGEETARAMLADPAGKQTSIIILTSMGQRGDASRLEAMGCSGYLLKPVKQHMLYDALIAVLGQKKGESEAGRLITRHTISEAIRQDLRILLA
jgi:two-component system sensor histidine kinase/response regulator